jgi:hypothetical protein
LSPAFFEEKRRRDTTKVSKAKLFPALRRAIVFGNVRALSGRAEAFRAPGYGEKRGRAGAISRRNSPKLGFHQ